tara:strand:+ start:9110 stop:10168 length:1059 start_codon:yes stop_codon:yes gene_type:complete
MLAYFRVNNEQLISSNNMTTVEPAMTEKPNIFSFATTELSQDAFIAWLLAWADLRYESVDPQLHKCARKLIGAFFAKHGKPMPHFTEVTVTRQSKNIDVLCVLDGTFAIVIEDKTHTEAHSNQLAKYLADIQGRGYQTDNTLAIYFKTGDQTCYKAIYRNGFQPFTRRDFLAVLEAGVGTSNAIFHDYLAWLQHWDTRVEAYRTKPFGEWDGYAWIGFYKALKEQLGEGNWGYVPNQSGGFLGFWCCFQDILHVQLVDNRELRFRIDVPDVTQRAALRREWFNKIVKHSEAFGLKTKKPARFGNGQSMVVAVFNGEDFRQTDQNGHVDLDATVRLINQAKALLTSLAPEPVK